MKHYTGCDAHKKYSVFTTISEAGEIFPAKRVEHDRQKFRSFLETLPTGSSIARSCQKVCKCQAMASTSSRLVSISSFLSWKPNPR